MFFLFLSLFTLTANSPLSEICKTTNSSLEFELEVRDCGLLRNLVFTYISAALVIILSIVHLIKELLQMLQSKRYNYLLDGQNVNELLLFTLSIVFVFIFPNNCGCPMDWQWNIGIFAVFLAWFNLLFFTSEIPYTGIYVLIFKEILVTFLKLISFSIILVMGFSLILFMMFFNPSAQISSFSNIGHSFVKTITMVTGELGFEDNFDLGVSPSDYIPIPFHASNFIMWIFFVVLIPIILNNMLTSLAVEDTGKIRANAELQELKLQVKTLLKAQQFVKYVKKTCCKNKCCRVDSDDSPTGTFRFNESSSKRMQLGLFLLGGKDFTTEYIRDTYNTNRKEEREKICAQHSVQTDPKVYQEYVQKHLEQMSDMVEVWKLQRDVADN